MEEARDVWGSEGLTDVARMWGEAREVELVVQGAHLPLTAGENCTPGCGGVRFVSWESVSRNSGGVLEEVRVAGGSEGFLAWKSPE